MGQLIKTREVYYPQVPPITIKPGEYMCFTIRFTQTLLKDDNINVILYDTKRNTYSISLVIGQQDNYRRFISIPNDFFIWNMKTDQVT